MGSLTETEQIDQKYQEDLQRLRGFLLHRRSGYVLWDIGRQSEIL